jgi:hypothetical protein
MNVFMSFSFLERLQALPGLFYGDLAVGTVTLGCLVSALAFSVYALTYKSNKG